MSRRWWLAALLLVVVAGLVPYRELLWHLPWGADASKWVMYASTDNPDWWQWVFDHKHFVGYRPVTALTFVLNQATTGYEAWGYRGLDLSLHALTGLMLFGVWRALVGKDGGFGLVAVLVLLGHPATEEVLPYVARRSYLLATAFGLGSLFAFARGVEAGGRRGWAWASLAALLLGLGVLSNEVAYVLLPLLPMLALHLASDGRRIEAVRLWAPSLLVAAGAIVARYLVLGKWSGGYVKRYFAFVHGGKPTWRELTAWQPRQIAEACWSYTLDPHSVSGHAALAPGVLGTWVVGGLLAWGSWACFVKPVLRIDDREGRLPLILGVWMFGATAIVVLSQTWFWRQAYTLLPPLGLLVGLTLRDAVQAARQRRWIAALDGLPAALVVALALYNSPILGGMDRSVHGARIHGTAMMAKLRELTDDLPGPGRVYMVVPMRASAAHLLRISGDRFGNDRQIEFRLLAHLSKRAKGPKTSRVAVADGALTLEEGLEFSLTGPVAAAKPVDGRIEIERLRLRNRDAWIAVVDGQGSFRVDLRRRAAAAPGVEEIDEPEFVDTGLADEAQDGGGAPGG